MKCEVCGSSDNLHKHHISYNPEEKTIYLCSRHHAMWHNRKLYGKRVEEVVSILKSTDDWVFNLGFPEISEEDKFDFSGLEYAMTGERPIHLMVWGGLTGGGHKLNPSNNEDYRILREMSRMIRSLSEEELTEYRKMKREFLRTLGFGLVEDLCLAIYKGSAKEALLNISEEEDQE